MEADQHNHFSDFENLKLQYRRKLLPWWVRFFSWLFMIMGGLAVVCVVLGMLLARNFPVSFYGFDMAPYPYNNFISTICLVFNGITGLFLWTEKKQAVQLAKICAIAGIVICALSNIGSLFYGHFTLRLEIIFLVIFYRKMDAIEYEWEINAVSRAGND